MLKMNLQLFGGRGSAGGNNPEGNKATQEKVRQSQELANRPFEQRTDVNRQVVRIGSKKDINEATFKKGITGSYVATVGKIEYPGTKETFPAVEMRIMPGRDNGKSFYTTRFIVHGGDRDWQYDTTKYSSLNAAKKGVKESLIDYVNEEIMKRRR